LNYQYCVVKKYWEWVLSNSSKESMRERLVLVAFFGHTSNDSLVTSVLTAEHNNNLTGLQAKENGDEKTNKRKMKQSNTQFDHSDECLKRYLKRKNAFFLTFPHSAFLLLSLLVTSS
jgi:hypothetical protein